MKRRTMDPWNEVIKPHLLEIEGWARDGVIDKDIAERLGIAYSTFKRHKLSGQHPEFAKALERGKNVVDTEVENALLKKALGFSYNEITQEASGANGTLKVTKVTKKEFPPDVAACIIWLTNRRGDKWKNRIRDDANNEDALAKLDALMAKVDEEMRPAATPVPAIDTEGAKPK